MLNEKLVWGLLAALLMNSPACPSVIGIQMNLISFELDADYWGCVAQVRIGFQPRPVDYDRYETCFGNSNSKQNGKKRKPQIAVNRNFLLTL